MRSFQNFSRSIILIITIGDVFFLFISYFLAFWIRSLSHFIIFYDIIPLDRFHTYYNHHYWLLIGLQIFLFYSFGLYDRLKQIRFIEMIWYSSLAVTLQVLLLIAYYYFSNDLIFPRSIFPVFWLLNILFVSTWRIIISRWLKLKGVKRRVLIVGTSEVARELIQEIERFETTGLEIVGIVTGTVNGNEKTEFAGYPVMGSDEDLLSVIEDNEINEVIITHHFSWQDRLLADITKSQKSQARVLIVPSMYEIMIARLHHLKIYDIPLVEVLREPTDTLTRTGKLILDFFFAVIGLILTGLLFPWIAILIKMTSPGPIIYRQQRIGKDGQPFDIYKFRTMKDNAESQTGPVFCSPNDHRITLVGSFLRRWRIDELPQFYCILKGDMSLVGPRPERPHFVEKFNKDILGYSIRFRIKPGMTGLAQVNGSNMTVAENKLRYDLAYLYNQSLWLDILILIETIKVIITGQTS